MANNSKVSLFFMLVVSHRFPQSSCCHLPDWQLGAENSLLSSNTHNLQSLRVVLRGWRWVKGWVCSLCVCMCACLCLCGKPTPKPKLETALNSSLSVQMSVIASSQPQELEISTPEAHHCLQDADVSLVWLPAHGYIKQELWEQGQAVLRGPSRAQVTVLLQGPSWWPLLSSCLSLGGWSWYASWRKAQCKWHARLFPVGLAEWAKIFLCYSVCTICPLSKCLPRSPAVEIVLSCSIPRPTHITGKNP